MPISYVLENIKRTTGLRCLCWRANGRNDLSSLYLAGVIQDQDLLKIQLSVILAIDVYRITIEPGDGYIAVLITR